jgi:hypothetical protein
MNLAVIAWGAIVIGGGTWLGFPIWGPVTGGLLLGLFAPRPAVHAAVAGAVAWGGLLALASTQGSLALTASRLGGALGLAPWGPIVATLLYPALLAASAAWLTGLASRRRATPASSSRLAA